MIGITSADAEYALALCDRIAAHTDARGTITRTYLSRATQAVHTLLREEMQAAGMTVRTDAAGNLRGLYPAEHSDQATPVLLFGSHIDTVPDAGRYDGILGVAVPLALVRALKGQRLSYAIEVVAFSEEEGIRFKLPFLGSRALTGTLGPQELARVDADGVSMEHAIRSFGLNPEHLHDALLTPQTFAFLEVHIEQGPVLESLGFPLGIVETIVGQSRFELTFQGEANHAGTTPMNLRRDALSAAAAFISATEEIARATPGLVATVGVIQARPGAPNIIPGEVICSLDMRHAEDAIRETNADDLLSQTGADCLSRGVKLTAHKTSTQTSVAMDPQLRNLLARSAESAGHAAHRMASGAGHDAMIVAALIPAAMLFLRTPGGLSHHPGESVLSADVQAALDTCARFLEALKA